VNARAVALTQAFGIIFLSQLMGVLSKIALLEVPAFTFVWLQLATAIAFMLFYTYGWKRERLPTDFGFAEWGAVVFVGLVNFGICRYCMLLGIERLPMNTFVFLLSFVSLFTLGLSVVFLRERPGRLQLVGILLAIFGVWLYFPDVPPPDELTGVAFAGVVVIGLASCNNVTRWLMNRPLSPISAAQFSTLGILIGGIPLVTAGLAIDGIPQLGGTTNALIIVANGLIGTALAQTVFNGVLKTLRSYEASVVASSGLVWTALLAIPFLDEWLVPAQVGAIVVMMTGVVLAQWRPST